MLTVLKSVFAVFLAGSIVLYSDKMTGAAFDGLNLWLYTVIPSLFPFMVISSWLSFNTKPHFGTADKITMKLFGIPSGLMPVFLISMLSGYPTGARIISSLYSKNSISKDTAEHMLSFCNNPGAVFIISAVSSSILSDRASAPFFLAICIYSSLLTGFIYNLLFPCRYKSYMKPLVSAKSGIYDSLSSSVKSILLVGGCIIFFSVVTEAFMNIIPEDYKAVGGIIGGMLEFTRGISLTAASGYSPKIAYSLIAAILCWGGFSVHLQTLAVIGESDINIKKYIVCKAFSSVVAYTTSFILYDIYFFKSSVYPVFSEIYTYHSAFAAASFLAIFIFFFFREKK